MILGLLAWLISGLFLMLLSFSILRFLHINRPVLELVSFLFLVIFTTTFLMLVVGLLGWLRPAPILFVSLAGVASIITIGSGEGVLTEVLAELRAIPRAVRQWWRGLPIWLRWFAGTAAVLSGARFIFLTWALPPFVWDSLSYHLSNVAHWVQVGRIETFATPVVRIFNPANYEVLAAWFTVFVHHDAVVEAAGVPPYLLAVLAVYAAARGLGRSRPASWMCALAYGSTPAVILAATGTKNDIHIAAYYLVGLALICDLSFRSPGSSSRKVLGSLTLLALVFLLALGTKTYILHLAPGLLLVGLLGTRLDGRMTNWAIHLNAGWQEFLALARPRRLLLAALLVSGLFLGTFWNLRNWVVTGNPFYPYDVLLAGKAVFEGHESEFRVSLRELRANLENFAGKFGDWQDPIRPDLPNTTGWGWFAYAIGLPAVAWATFRRPRTRPLLLGFGLSFILLMLSTGPSPWNMRFVIWFPALFSLCFAELTDALPPLLPRSLRLGLPAYFTLMLSLNFIATLNYNRVSAEEFQGMLALPVRERDAALFRDNMPDPYTLANQIVPSQDVLGYNVFGNGFTYPLYRADYSQRIVYVPFKVSDSCEVIAGAMEARGTRYLLVAPEHTEDDKIALLRACADSGSLIKERARGLYVIKP